MIYKLARLLQLAGMTILPVAIAGELAHSLDLRQSLTLSGIGVAVFALGWLLQQGTRPR
jgi:hypothetical protein